MNKISPNPEKKLFDDFRSNILNIDPIYFCENNLTILGDKFDFSEGYKPFADIYRYIALKAVEKDTLPVILVKGRQVGATVMAAALEAYFVACGLYGSNGRPPMRIMHLFPSLVLAAAYTKTKLAPMIQAAKPSEIIKKNGQPKSIMELKMDSSTVGNDNQHYKRFIGGNEIWIESLGLDADRVRGRSVDCLFYDECFPGEQLIETVQGNINIKTLYDMYLNNEELPRVKSLNTEEDLIEPKEITKVWSRGKRKLLQLEITGHKIKCTENHPFLTTDGWVYAKNLKDKTIFAMHFGKPTLAYCTNVTDDGFENTYDIEVKDNHNFIVVLKDELSLIAHNCQDMTDVGIGTADKTATQSNYGSNNQGIKVLFGTPKQKGGFYYKMWLSSSQQYYHLFCSKCEDYFPLYRPDVNWEEIWLYGYIVKCTHCGHEQNKIKAAAKGKWIPLNNDPRHPPKMIGYHINQLYIPKFAKEDIIKEKPENHPTNTERIYMNEVLGEFYDGDGSTISKQDILDRCLEDRYFAKIISPADNIRVYAGFDWGQKASLDIASGKRTKGQSYSCCVVLTAHGPELFSIDFATRLGRNDWEGKHDIVEEMFRRYSVNLAVGDVGDAHDLTEQLQKKYGDMFLGSRAQDRVNNHVKYDDDGFPKVITFERNYYISELISLLKRGCIKFPRKSYEQVEWLINHCCSMEIKITHDRSGDPIKRYVKGNEPNDGFMALLNAYLAWKFDVSQRFNIKNPSNLKHEIAQGAGVLRPIIGYVPKMR